MSCPADPSGQRPCLQAQAETQRCPSCFQGRRSCQTLPAVAAPGCRSWQRCCQSSIALHGETGVKIQHQASSGHMFLGRPLLAYTHVHRQQRSKPAKVQRIMCSFAKNFMSKPFGLLWLCRLTPAASFPSLAWHPTKSIACMPFNASTKLAQTFLGPFGSGRVYVWDELPAAGVGSPGVQVVQPEGGASAGAGVAHSGLLPVLV